MHSISKIFTVLQRKCQNFLKRISELWILPIIITFSKSFSQDIHRYCNDCNVLTVDDGRRIESSNNVIGKLERHQAVHDPKIQWITWSQGMGLPSGWTKKQVNGSLITSLRDVFLFYTFPPIIYFIQWRSSSWLELNAIVYSSKQPY